MKEYRLFFKAERTRAGRSYFKVDNPAKNDKIVWMWADRNATAQMLKEAFMGEKKILVVAGPPHNGLFGDGLMAKVYECEIEA